MPPNRHFALDTRLFNSSLYSRIQALWFAEVPQGATAPSDSSFKKWFYNPNKDEKEAFDRTCSSDFSAALKSIDPTHLQLPPLTRLPPDGLLARSIAAPFLSEIGTNATSQIDEGATASNALSLLLLLDQMPRNVFRTNQSLIYNHYDRLSQALIHVILAETPRLDLHPRFRLFPVYRMWFYMPLMHSEHIADHLLLESLGLSMKADTEQQNDPAGLAYIDQSLDFEKQHVDIIKRFGRYPYRNSVLQRETTEKEREWIENGGDTFGT